VRIALALCLLSAGLVARAEDPAQAFKEAAQAYDAGHFEVAATNYTRLIEAGWVSPALFFNAGNAAFRNNDLGAAVLHYRRAWSLAPRDSEIAANLRFALERAGVAGSLLTPWEYACSRLDLPEWTLLAVVSYWLAAAAWAWWLLRGRPVGGKRLAASFSALALLGLMGAGFWLDWRARPEWVVVAPGQQALFAPLDGGTPHFGLPAGSVVRLREESGDWLRIRVGKDEGWVRRSACIRVLPWQDGQKQ
jgi:hypothetical protein